MLWNTAPELIAAIVMVVLIGNSHGVQSVPSPRNKMFTLSLYFTLFCNLLNSLSVLTIMHATRVPLWVNMVTNTLGFIIYPYMPMLFIVYLLLFIFESVPPAHRKRLHTVLAIIGILAVANLLLSCLNITTGWLFSFDGAGNYVRGPLNRWTMALVFVCTLMGLSLCALEGTYIPRYLRNIIFWFPMLSLGISALQLLYPNLILSGTAMMIAILIVYLNFQTKKISEDNLTKLPNRETFFQITEFNARKNRSATLLLISLDDFQVINDTYGQVKGDTYLVAVAKGIGELFPNQPVFRYSGDEFVVALKDSYPLRHGRQPIEHAMERFNLPWVVDGVPVWLGASMVVLRFPFKTEEPVDPIALMDYAMRTAKKLGKRQGVLCDESTFRAMKRRNRLIQELGKRITSGTFTLNYQPIYNLDNGRMMMAEALIRMHDEILGEVGPAEFIPLAEEAGLINVVGMWVFEQVCIFINRLQKKGLQSPSISINFSGQQFADTHLLENIVGLLGSYQIPRGTIKLEITESTFIGASYQEILSIMNPLIEQGILFHLDDFGTGYSNLSYVINLPFECVKLDKTLLWDVDNKDRMQLFIETLIKGVVQTGAKVIVEGIETQSQVDFLRRAKCDMVQGYIFSPPMTVEDFETSLS